MGLHQRRRGSILFLSLAISGILLMWAAAAVHQANFQSRVNLHSYRKSELFFLSKRALSRSLFRLNTDPGWRERHLGRQQADETTPHTRCWLEASGNSLTLRCEARLGSQSQLLSVPVLADTDSSLRIYSVGPSSNGGDFVSWTSRGRDGWNALPPIAGRPTILSLSTTPNGDVFAVAQARTGSALWRYRQGRGWVRMPDTPGNVGLLSVSASGSERLICKSERNSVLIFPLQDSPTGSVMQWQTVAAPEGVELGQVAAHPSGGANWFATTTSANGAQVYQNHEGQWQALPRPTQVAYQSDSGANIPPTAALDFSGGIAMGEGGAIHVASNSPGSASLIYTFQPSSPGSASGTWTASPPVHEVVWINQQAASLPSYTTRLDHLVTDREGQLWAQATSRDGAHVSNLHLILPE